MRHKKVGERKRLWNNEEREKKRKESKKVRDGLKEQIWRNEEEQVERVVRDKTKDKEEETALFHWLTHHCRASCSW